MDGRGGCCIARYAGGAYDMSKMDRIMLRFRPIAPKPANGSASNGPRQDQTEISQRSGKRKRRYSSNSNQNSKKSNGGGRKRKSSSTSSQEKMDVVVTLPLLPETPQRRDSPARVSPVRALSPIQSHGNAPDWLSFDKTMESRDPKAILDPTIAMMSQALVRSCVTVECVTDTWVDGNGMASTDGERVNHLWNDTCPGFISDGMDRVTWTNKSFQKMVGQENDVGPVSVVMKESASAMMAMTWRAFTCRVRLQYTRGREKSSLTLPCDVWRLDGGGFAWRLDVEAALCLGR